MRRKLLSAALSALLCVGCGSHAVASRSAQTIASCLRRAQDTVVVADRVSPPPDARPGPKPRFVITGADGGVVFVYGTDRAAESSFNGEQFDNFVATRGDVVAVYGPNLGTSSASRDALLRCAFGPGAKPEIRGPVVPRTGEEVLGEAGCLACHRLGMQGNNGPGPDLTMVGRRLSPQVIARVLASPTPPMPSFRSLPPAQFRLLVDYLSQLR